MKKDIKIGIVYGVNDYENAAMLQALNDATVAMKDAGGRLDLEILIERPQLAEFYLLRDSELTNLNTDGYREIEDAMLDRLCESIRVLKRGGAQKIIIPYGAQMVYPTDYIIEKTGCSPCHVLYLTVRNMVKGVVQRREMKSFQEEQLQIKRVGMLGALGVMGLFRPAESFSNSDYLEEHIEKVSYSLASPSDRVTVWQHLSDVFYGKEKEDGALTREFCVTETEKMANFYQRVFSRKGLQGLFVTDFWTEKLLAVEHPTDGLVGQTMLPNGLKLPTINLERVEAWAIINDLLNGDDNRLPE